MSDHEFTLRDAGEDDVSTDYAVTRSRYVPKGRDSRPSNTSMLNMLVQPRKKSRLSSKMVNLSNETTGYQMTTTLDMPQPSFEQPQVVDDIDIRHKTAELPLEKSQPMLKMQSGSDITENTNHSDMNFNEVRSQLQSRDKGSKISMFNRSRHSTHIYKNFK